MSARWVVATLVTSASLGVAIPWLASKPLLIALGLFMALVLLFEIVRRTKAASVPLWIAYSSIAPWAAIVLIPWLYSSIGGAWIRAGVHVDFDLPHTFRYHLFALFGMCIGTLRALHRHDDRHTGYRRIVAQPSVQWLRVSVVMLGCLCLYALSFVLAGRSATALWKLGGTVVYFEQTDAATRIAILDLIPIIATVLLLVAATVRRLHTKAPARLELFWLAVLGALALGSGVRARLYLLVLGWLVVQFHPVLVHRAQTALKKWVVLVGGLAILASALWIAGPISQLRSAQSDENQSAIDVAIRGLDVISTGEILFARGATPGMLNGKSYAELPSLFLPRRIIGEAKANPAADVLMRDLLDRRAGYAAPLWLESALNFGAVGVVAFSVVYSWMFTTVLQRRSRGTRLMALVRLLGPVWVLASYIVLSHLTLLHTIATIGAIVLGACIAIPSLRWDATGVAASDFRHEMHVPAAM